MPGVSRRITSLLALYRRDRRANVAVTFALALLPIMTAVGFAIDYSVAIQVKAKLGSAADAASVAAVSQRSAGYTAAIAMTANGAVPAGVTEANAIFNGNVSNINGYANLAVTPVVTKSGSTLTATVNYSADVPNLFLGVIGRPKMTVSGTSISTATLPLYLDFYVMLDVSGSMGLPSTNSEQTRLAAVNPDNFTQYPNGCVFACHFSSAGACSIATEKYPTLGFCQGYAVTRVGYTSLLALLAQNAGKLPSTLLSTLFPVTSCSTPGTDACIQLRADAVGYAVQQLLITANGSEKMANQFRIGLYPFIRYLNAYYAPLTASINGSASIPGTINYAAANLASQLDTGVNLTLGSARDAFRERDSSDEQYHHQCRRRQRIDQDVSLRVPDYRWCTKQPNLYAGQLGWQQFRDDVGSFAVHDNEEPRHHHLGALHSLSANPESDDVRQLGRLLRQRQYSLYLAGLAVLRVAGVLLYGERALRHHRSTQRDVQPRAGHGAHHELNSVRYELLRQ